MEGGRRLEIKGRVFPITTGRGYYGANPAAGATSGTSTGRLNKATIVLERTGYDAHNQPVYEILTSFPSL